MIVAGPEPSVRWRDVTSDLVQVAQRLDVKLAVTLGGMPAPVSHRRPVNVLATASSRSVAQEVGALRADYFGPTGAQTVLQVALGDAGIRAVGFWAQVPHYVAATPSPPAIRAMLERLREVAGLTVDLHALDEQSDAYLERVEEGLSERPDVADMVLPARGADRTRRSRCPARTWPARSSGSCATSADRQTVQRSAV